MKKRADTILVESGMVEDIRKARSLIMQGLVYTDEIKIEKPGDQLDENVDLIIRGDNKTFVSRGGKKLEKAIQEFKINLNNKITMDVGASTGGFTDCMLRAGAELVYAVDVGYGQLDWTLRNNKKVVVMERTNIRDVVLEDLNSELGFVSIDVSFISLKLVLPVIKKLLDHDAKVVALVKPQFEANKEDVGKGGIVKEKDIHKNVLVDIIGKSIGMGYSIEGLSYSPIKGATGNIEFLLFLGINGDIENNFNYGYIDEVIDEAHRNLL